MKSNHLSNTTWLSEKEDASVLIDFVKCQQSIIRLFRNAKSTIYYSTFLCDFNHSMTDEYGVLVTMKELIHHAVARKVKVHILYNPAVDYGTSSVETMQQNLPKEVKIHSSVSDLGPGWLAKFLCNNSKYGYHHQKYICVDGDMKEGARMMVTGCDVNEERGGWLEKNGFGYFWHELGVVFNCSTELYEYIASHHQTSTRHIYYSQFVPAPSPLVNGGWNEEKLMVELISTAKTSIQLENQIFISGGQWQENRISQALVERVCLAIENEDKFYALVLSNTAQQDEPSFLTRVFCEKSMQYTISGIEALATQRGLSLKKLYSRLVIGRLEHDGTLVKVHSNIIIQDGTRMIRTSSNLTDRSISHLPCDVELGVMLEGKVVHQLQQDLLKMYAHHVKQNEYSIQNIVTNLQHQTSYGLIHLIRSTTFSKLSHWWNVALMGFFVLMGGGSTGGRCSVTYETTAC